MTLTIRKLLLALLGLKLFIAYVAAFGHYSHPHIIRQTDTIGVSMRYAMKFQEEFQLYDLLPTSLATGDFKNEVTPMEFPLLNLITSGVFMIGTDYDYAFAQIILLTIYAILFLIAYRQAKNISENVALAWIITPLYGIPYIYAIRFMPDFFSFLLMSIGAFYFYQDRRKFLATVLCALALLVKPPMIIVFGLLLLKRTWIKQIGYLICAIIPAALYYTIGMKYLISLSHEPGYFAVKFRDPIESLKDFLSSPKEIMILVFKDILARYSAALILVAAFITKVKPDWRLFAILGLQILAIAILDGDHSFIHAYYFIGTGLITALILAPYCRHKVGFAIALFLAVINIESGIAQLKTVFRHNIRQECREILAAIPELEEETHIRTVKSPIPELGVCLGKITNSQQAQFGVYKKDDAIRCSEEVYQTNSFIVCQYK